MIDREVKNLNKKKITYLILREVNKRNRPTADDFGISDKEFCNIIQNLISARLIENASVTKNGLMALIKEARVTLRGQDYLDENSAWNKVYSNVKELRDWIKL